MPIIETSFWERAGYIDPASASSRERFSRRYARWKALASAKDPDQPREGGYSFPALRAQDVPMDGPLEVLITREQLDALTLRAFREVLQALDLNAA